MLETTAETRLSNVARLHLTSEPARSVRLRTGLIQGLQGYAGPMIHEQRTYEIEAIEATSYGLGIIPVEVHGLGSAAGAHSTQSAPSSKLGYHTGYGILDSAWTVRR